jgi:opacity protein-like surface antigen
MAMPVRNVTWVKKIVAQKRKNKNMIGKSKMAACAVLSLGLATASAQVYLQPTDVTSTDVAPTDAALVNVAFNDVAPTNVPPADVASTDVATDAADTGRDLGFYVGGGLGASFMPGFQSSRLGFPGSFSMRPGIRFSAEPGYNFMATDRLALGGEFETGVIYNEISSVSGSGSPGPLRGRYYQVPLLGNLVLTVHPNSFVVPYVGVGGGGDYSSARIRSLGFFGYGTSDQEVDPAVQAMAGVRFRLNANTDLGLGYKFLVALPGEGGSIQTHSVMASFTVRF